MRRWIAGVTLLLVVSFQAHAKKPKKGKANAKEPVPAEVAPQPVPEFELPCGYAVGDTQRFRIDDTTIKTSSGGAEEVVHLRWEVQVTVLSVESSSMVVELVDEGFAIVDPPDDPFGASLLERLTAMEGGAPPRVEVHVDGTQRLVNADEMAQWGETALPTMMKEFQPMLAELPPEAGAGIEQMLRRMVTEPAILEGQATKTTRPMFAYTCGTIPTSGSFDAALPNALGGPPFPARIDLAITGGDASFHVSEVTRLDSVGAAEIIRPLFPEGTLPPEAESVIATLNIDVTTDMQLDMSTDAWPLAWTIETRTGAGPGINRVERRVLTRID